jgi:hypothetical protein
MPVARCSHVCRTIRAREGWSAKLPTCQNPAASSSHSFPPSGNFQTADLALQLLLLDGRWFRRAGLTSGEGRSRFSC